MTKRWITLVALGLAVLAWRAATAHKLPNFPQVRLQSAEVGRDDSLLRRLTVQVRDPTGKELVSGAEVTVWALHATFGSGLRVEAIQLAPARDPGIYQGEIRFPRAGRWELTIEVIGRYVGDAHFELDVTAPSVSDEGPTQDKPELDFDLPTIRHLAMEWGHLIGFALWLVATAVGLLNPVRYRWLVLIATWAAFTIQGVTGLYKMEYSTPFATPLRLFNLSQIPGVFFAREYISILVVKHVLMLTAMAITLALTLRVWRAKPGERVLLWRALLGVNLTLALAIAAAAAVLGFYHAIVLHFS
ncbi:MAG: hypothetical protein HYY65_15075 [Candidatus Tectomicrobia bacterium]|uniref:YtkA-like domain-containing protein n=1 Tax=Tectimicrobiota bacterium TaxID=2528274 RepID=A0A932M2X2_UNCTE|nr:hypothetical protein [Candidatus Tectomicrobia bacterium]